jgi:chromosome segregation ATPase
MKTIKTSLIALTIAAALFSCDTKEKALLQHKVDSLNVELQASNQVAEEMQEVGQMIDSIDASRQLLRTQVVEGTTYADYSNRLKDINAYIRETQNKIAEMEKSVKNQKGLTASIKKLKADIESKTQQITALQAEVERMHSENTALTIALNQKDSTIAKKDEVIKVREENIASLEGLVNDINSQTQITTANLYFEQAKALELAAKRTNFAPRKKKETKREALELYKLALSLGKQEAQERITELEKDLS